MNNPISEKALAEIKSLEDDFRSKVREVLIKEARANNPYSVGDILEDHYQVARVDEIKVEIIVGSYKYYRVYYKCTKLTKALVPYKTNSSSTMFMEDVKRLVKSRKEK